MSSVEKLLSAIAALDVGQVRLMEVCGTHTMSIAKSGIKSMLPENVQLLSGSHGLPEAIAIAAVIALHLWKRQTLLSIAGGTVCYMALVQTIF